MPQQKIHPIVVPESLWSNKSTMVNSGWWYDGISQLEWMLSRKGYLRNEIREIGKDHIQAELEKYYIINDLDIRKIQEQEAAGNYFLMSLYVNTMVFDKAAL